MGENYIKKSRKEYFVDENTNILKMARELNKSDNLHIVALECEGNLRSLLYRPDREELIRFVTLESDSGQRILERSLTLVFLAALKEILPKKEVVAEHSLAGGVYFLIRGEKASSSIKKQIINRMNQFIDDDESILREMLSKEEAKELFREKEYLDKYYMIEHDSREEVIFYRLGKIRDTFYGELLPSCGFIEEFEIEIHDQGFVVLFPNKNTNFVMPNFIPQEKLAREFSEAEKYGEILDVATVGDLNYHINKGRSDLIIKVSEAFHERKIAKIAEDVVSKGDKGNLILIAGPSSSGKTTFMERLKIQLMTHGKFPINISLDNYFIDRDKNPKDSNGDYNYEDLSSLDVELFNRNLEDLLNGFKTEIPKYNFYTGKREKGFTLKREKDQPILVEGIHGLNDKLTYSMGAKEKYKVYISALTQLNIDRHNRIPSTDTRKLRRMVRDSQFRGTSILQTLNRWNSVRIGEEKNIFPFQEEADAMFNSALVYELAVLKLVAEPLLNRVKKDDFHYQEAQRLLTFLSCFAKMPIENKSIPFNSIIREFVGEICCDDGGK